VKIVRAETYKLTPWKNGCGVTREIAVFPDNASVDNFSWRVSMADVGADGLFSKFDNIDRTLSVLTGQGIRLQVSDAPAVVLTQSSAPFRFRGDASTRSWLLNGAITDLNVMTRRDQFAHKVTFARNARELSIQACSDAETLVIPLDTCRVTGREFDVGPLDVLTVESSDGTIRLECLQDTTFYIIEIQMHAASDKCSDEPLRAG
jgi:environmental stress-induced protein Ves